MTTQKIVLATRLLRPSFATARHESVCLRKYGEAERRTTRVEDPSRKFGRARPSGFQSGARHGWFRVTAKHPSRGALAFRRSAATLARLYAWLSFGLRLPGSAAARAATTPF